MSSSLKSRDFQIFLYKDSEVPVKEHQDERKATFLIKKHISLKLYNLVGI